MLTLYTNINDAYTSAVALSTAQQFPSGSGTITPGVYYSNTNISLTSQTITFNGAGQYIIYVNNAAGYISLTTCTFIYNGVDPSTIFWYSPNGITFVGPNAGVCGIFLAYGTQSSNTPAITATDTTFNGNLYAGNSLASPSPQGAITLTSDIFNPETVCYLRGTKILTENRFVSIENLKIGDNVISKGSIMNDSCVVILNKMDAIKPIKWIGHFYAGRRDTSSLPIRFKTGSLGNNVPFNDLFVSPSHRIIVDGKMIFASDALNGNSIVQENNVEIIQYFTFELDCHSVINAEGALAETLFEHEEGYYKKLFVL